MALPATDWTVTTEHRRIQNKERRNLLKLVLASGTYPSDGVPLPINGKLGMVRNLDHILITDADSFGNLIKFINYFLGSQSTIIVVI